MFGLGSKIESISTDNIKREMDNGAILVDIRNKEYFDSGHIQGAINIPIGSLAFNTGKLDKSKTILVICYVGGSSKMAASILRKAGFNSKNVLGGMEAWKGKVVS